MGVFLARVVHQMAMRSSMTLFIVVVAMRTFHLFCVLTINIFHMILRLELGHY